MQSKRNCESCLSEIDAGCASCPHCGKVLAPALSPDAPAPVAAAVRGETLTAYDTRGDVSQRSPTPAGVAEPPPDPTLRDFKTVHPRAAEESQELWTDGSKVAGRFRILGLVGQGGMGKVYLARDEILARSIALKRIPQEIIYDHDARDDLRQEANLLLDLAHENIVRIHTYYDEPDWPFFAMEFLEGPTLKTLLHQRKKSGRVFAFPEVIAIARQVGKGLEYAHRKGLIHRDLKPGNLMLGNAPGETITDADTVKITDFGISRVVADSSLRQTGQRSGTLPYMSPEQFRGEECTPQSDIYSLAATFYELLSGRPPFFTGDIGYQILNLSPKPIPGLPRGANAALLRAMEKHPQHRFDSVAEFIAQLERRRRFPDLYTATYYLKRFGLRAAASLALVLVLVLAGFGVHALVGGARAGLPGGQSRVSRNPAVAVEPEVFGLQVQNQLLKNLPTRTSAAKVSFQIRREGALDAAREAFTGIYFILDPGPGQREVRPEALQQGSVLEFRIEGLEDGEHRVRMALEPSALELVPLRESMHFEQDFTVDRTGPEFRVEPVRREAFVDVGSDGKYFSTFRETCSFQLQSAEAADIAEAYFRIVRREQRGDLMQGEEFHIGRPFRWDVRLNEGQNIFRLQTEDQLGNRSKDLEVIITRLRLGIDEYVIDQKGRRGNRVEVRGRLNVEGIRLPKLHFFINDAQVSDLGRQYVEPTRLSPSFRASLQLPRFQNQVELRYEWGGEVFAFNPPAILDVQVVAPEVILLTEVPARTKENHLKLLGRIRPYFKGLSVAVHHRGVGRFTLSPRSSLGEEEVADFENELWLSPDKTNEFEFSSQYDGKVLESTPRVVTTYCDLTKPALLEPLRCFPHGAKLHVVITPSEAVSQIRIREGDNGEWRAVSEQESEGVYLHIMDLPSRRLTLTVELIDQVGNRNELSQVCESFMSAGAPPAGSNGEAPARKVEPRADGDGPRSTALSPLGLADLGLEFRPFGKGGEELGLTEVNERAWTTYLKEKKLFSVEPGDPRRPALVGGKYSDAAILGFASWLTERADDRFEYFVPSVDQWLCAFAGESDRVLALAEIRNWFEGRHSSGSFSPILPPSLRYDGRGEALPVGSRRANASPRTGLLDMEANVQELVRGSDGRLRVIGGWNGLREYELKDACLEDRDLAPLLKDVGGALIGLRVGRRLKR